MSKSFDELTIADDYMFCTVMQDQELCKALLRLSHYSWNDKIYFSLCP